ncbi:GIY-YIG nuclease family protein [Candidatus Dojkabacteria bacterium]|jgi:putative endonuclease|uniref:GIY-YIG nuclease family protein n=1 Tax=Candidatus Dojkabacteria bacterium TaxID=2099670 RepID=A0A955I930_9BACT|nr:GIY-YIG nuclease family protein [Candidatus Dojkabacteria bacterium]
MKYYYVYIMTNKPKGTLYIGITNNLIRRVYEHKNDLIENSFTSRYSLHRLVYYEVYSYVWDAIRREKNIKKWKRNWKIRMIEEVNPNWEEITLI